MKNNKKYQEKLIDDYDYLSNAASSTDYTGLIPSLPQNEAELKSYNDICQFLPSSKSRPKPSKSHPDSEK